MEFECALSLFIMLLSLVGLDGRFSGSRGRVHKLPRAYWQTASVFDHPKCWGRKLTAIYEAFIPRFRCHLAEVIT